jgi:hypothetical protein
MHQNMCVNGVSVAETGWHVKSWSTRLDMDALLVGQPAFVGQLMGMVFCAIQHCIPALAHSAGRTVALGIWLVKASD